MSEIENAYIQAIINPPTDPRKRAIEMSPMQELNQALNRMKYHTNADDLYIYKTPGGWYHVTDSTFNMLLSAPTARALALCVDAYVAGYLQAIATHPQTQE